jgi:DNA-binding HxlR family transcriptional regulator
MPKVQPNVFNPNCDSRQVLALLADRWSMLIIYALGLPSHPHPARTGKRGLGVQRHGELKRTIGGISQKMLTQTLRSLERDASFAAACMPWCLHASNTA